MHRYKNTYLHIINEDPVEMRFPLLYWYLMLYYYLKVGLMLPATFIIDYANL